VLAQERQLGLSAFVSLGNRADISSNDLLEYWGEDERTGVILLYLESFGNARRFGELARRVGRRKPIVAVKSGRSPAGQRAAGSHTAALAADDVAAEALFHQCGVIRAATLNELFHLAAALSYQPPIAGRRVGVVTNAGGPGILCADACQAEGLQVPPLSETTRATLRAVLPPTASLANPVDMIAGAGAAEYRQAVAAVLADESIDALVVIHIPIGIADLAAVHQAILEGVATARAAGATAKPVLACRMAGVGECAPAPLVGEQETLPAYAFPEAPAVVLGRLATHAEWLARPPGTVPELDDVRPAKARAVIAAALAARGPGWLTAAETRAVLIAFGLPVAPGGVATTADEAAALAGAIGFPVALKLASQRVVHKTELGGVQLDLPDEAAVRQAFERIRTQLEGAGLGAAMEGVLVQPMIRDGVEVMVGLTADRVFGPLVAFGLGGIFVEILGDVCFRVTPLTDLDAQEMVRSIRGHRLLAGYRGHPAADIAAIETVLLRVSRLGRELPEVSELDLNPVFARLDGCCIADARIRLDPAAARPPG
jgi:acyl-CoA synthetase (NDP forming)